MKNLYNKHKSHVMYSIKLRSKKIIIIMMIMIFNISFLFTFKVIEKNFKPAVSALATAYAGTYTTSVINESIKQTSEINTDYSELCKINKNENGEIISVTTNTNTINIIKLNLSEKIIENINKVNHQELGVPIGNLTKTYILSGRGPKIPIKILTASSPGIDVESKFESAGVNQTKHKISIVAKVDIQIILPYEILTETVSCESLISETIIVGKVPDVYISK